MDGEFATELTIGDRSVIVRSLRGELRVSQLFSFDVDVLDQGEPLPPEDRLGKPCKLTLSPRVGLPLVVHGLVSGARSITVEHLDEAASDLEVEIRPLAFALTLGRDHRYFRELDATAILRKVLADANVEAGFSLGGSYRKRLYTVQYGESDWAFLERLLAEEGIAYRFDFSDDETKLVFFDDPTAAPSIEGGSVTFRDDARLSGDDDGVHTLSVRDVVTSTSVTMRDYDPKRPALDLEVEADAGKTLAIYDAPARYDLPADGKHLAHRRLEGLRALRRTIAGHSRGLRLIPGTSFSIEDAPRPPFDRQLFLESLTIGVELRSEEISDLRISFRAVPLDAGFRPPPREPARTVGGPQTAFVAGPSGKELYTDDAGLVRAQFHWDRVGKKDEQSTTFMRVGQFALGQSMVRPRIGWAVFVEHHQGDADQPFLWSHLYDGSHPPPYPLPANKTRTAWKTATTPGGGSANEIRFEDSKGKEEMFLNASKDMSVTVGDSKTKKVGNDHTHGIGANHDVKVGATRTLGVSADQTVEIGASETLTVSATRETKIGADDTVSVGASRTVTVIKGKKLDADGGRTMTVGANMIAVSAMAVSRSVLGSASVTVGGAWISAAATGLANVTAGASSETVGAVKLQLGGGGVSLTVNGALAETVGAAYVSAAGGNFGETASGAISFKVGGAFAGTAPSIEIEAKSEIKIICGGSSLTITNGSIELKAPAIPATAGSIAKTAGQIHHNP